MKTIEVTQMEAQVLEALAAEMYAERGFSSAGLEEVVRDTKLDPRTIRGVASSLIKKGLLYIDERKDEWGINWRDPNMHIWYLEGDAQGLVKEWHEEGAEPAELVIK